MEVHKKFQQGDMIESIPLDSHILGERSIYMVLKYTGKVPADVSMENVALHTYKVLVLQEPRLTYNHPRLGSRQGQVVMISVPEKPRRFDRTRWTVISEVEV
jgi:hypothetical protein